MGCSISTMTYDPKLIVVSFQGIIIKGYAAGTFVTARRDSPEWGKVTGVGGGSGRYQSLDNSGTMSVTLIQNSISNRDLSILQASARALSAVGLGGSSAGVFTIFDDIGDVLVYATEAWITGPPDISYGMDLTDRTWNFQTDNLEFLVGNAPEEETFNARLNLD